MKGRVIIYIMLLMFFGSNIQAQKLFFSLEGRFSSTSIQTHRSNTFLNKLYVSPGVGYELGENFHIGLITKIYRSNYTAYLPFSPDIEETENLNADKIGVFVDKNILIGEHFFLRLRPSLLYRMNDKFDYYRSRKIEIQLSPGIIYKAGNKIYIITNFRGIGFDDDFYFDFSFVHLNLGLQYNFWFEK